MRNKLPLILSCLFVVGIIVACSCAPPPAPSGQVLQISSLTPSQSQTFPGASVQMQSSVKAQPGENVVYKWSCTGGHFIDTGNNSTWVAPSQYGTYEITLAAEDSKGHKAQASVSITVSANKPPVISSMTTDRANLSYGGMTTVTVVASDPDGDALRYSWSASEGSVSGQGNRVTWSAPNKGGDYAITVLVSDGKSESRQSVVVRVMSTTNSTTISLIRQESGTVSSTGDKDTSRFRAGDDEKNVGYRCFFSFNIFSLDGTQVNHAKVKFGPARVTGDPFASVTGLGTFRISRATYGDGLPDYNIIPEQLQKTSTFDSAPLELDVTPELVNLVAAATGKFQMEAFFQKTTNGNNIAQFKEFSDAQLEVTFAPK